MDSVLVLLACLITALPGPPIVRYEDNYGSLYPINRSKCPLIDHKRDILYELFTRHNPVEGQPLALHNDEMLFKSHMNFSNPTVINFHGFAESHIATSAVSIRSAYMHRKDHNVIMLNALRLEAGPWYSHAVSNTRVVGQYSAMFIDYLVSKGLKLSQLHLIGHSLGAHLAGVAGRYVKSGKVARITGLDPAKPLFTNLPLNMRLDSTDAEFVDVIHTDTGIFGFPGSTGHADFYPNGGISPQPGCMLFEVFRRMPDSLLSPVFCSHRRSYQFFAESVVNPNSFLSVRCRTWKQYASGRCNNKNNGTLVNMGFALSSGAVRGNYYLRTNPVAPYSRD